MVQGEEMRRKIFGRMINLKLQQDMYVGCSKLRNFLHVGYFLEERGAIDTSPNNFAPS